MVFVNVPKLHALVGVLAATVAIPLGCSNDDFEGCEASRTCKPHDTGGTSGSGGTNAGGEAGDTETGGSSGSGTSGASGADDGGHGGSGDDTTRPTVVSITPDDGATEVERDIEITVTLSEPIDPASVTRRSATLEGPDGNVTGTLAVDGDVITFVAEKPLYLLGAYTFTLGDTVADLAGNTLADAASVAFQVRDGRWSEPVYPFGEMVPLVLTQFQRNVFGDGVLGMEVWPGRDTDYGAVYRAAENQWTEPTDLVAAAGSRVTGVAIDPERRAVVVATNRPAWWRFTEAEGWDDRRDLGNPAEIAATSTGLATAVFADPLSEDFLTRTQDLSEGSLLPEARFSPPSGTGLAYPVASLERTAVVSVEPTTSGQQLTVRWMQGNAWGPPEPLRVASDIGSLALDADEQGNIMVVWREDDQVWSRIYERAGDEWNRASFITNTTPDAIIAAIDLTAGSAVLAFSSFDPDPATWAAIYQTGVGWIEDSVIRLDDTWTGGAVAVSIDNAGNALASWHQELRYRRFLPGAGWQRRESLHTSVNAYYLWAAAAPDGSALVAGNGIDETGQNNQAPIAFRFE